MNDSTNIGTNVDTKESKLDKAHDYNKDNVCDDKQANGVIDLTTMYYDMSKKGYAVIFNHVYCLDYNKRVGTEQDANRLEKCLKKMNFDVEVHVDLTIDEISDVIEEVRNKTDISCLMIVLMTHGDKHNRVSAKTTMYRVNVLWEQFLGKFPGIPKLFFIQACRGSAQDDGYTGETETDSSSKTSTQKSPLNIDILQMFSSNEGYYSYRDQRGSWFIQELCEALEEQSKSFNLLELLTIVNNKVGYNYLTVAFSRAKREKKQMPQIVSTLTKFLKFNPVSEEC